MKIKSFHILILLILFFISEDFLLKWVPVNDFIFIALRLVGEFFLYLFLLFTLIKSLVLNGRIESTPIRIYLILFIVAILISGFMNQNAVFSIFMKIRVQLRYISAFYLVIHLTITESDVRKLHKALIITGVVQVFIGLYQQVFLKKLTPFWLPRMSAISLDGINQQNNALESGLKPGIIVGTMSLPGQFAIYLTIVSLTLITQFFYRNNQDIIRQEYKTNRVFYAVTLCLLLGVLISYSRSSVLMIMIALPMLAAFNNNFGKISRYGIIAVLIITPLLLLQFAFTELNSGSSNDGGGSAGGEVGALREIREGFSTDYIENEASGNRLWIIQHVGSTVFGEFKLFGYGSSEPEVRNALYQDGAPRRILIYPAFKDVYWFNLLAHFGIIGVLIFSSLLYKVYKMAKWSYFSDTTDTFRIHHSFMRGFIVIIALQTFFQSTFEYRPIALIFWVCLGITVNRYKLLKKELKH
ncbi:MAG: hypothetical protein Roseis2KO_22250 [Roseivirga sp.]